MVTIAQTFPLEQRKSGNHCVFYRYHARSYQFPLTTHYYQWYIRLPGGIIEGCRASRVEEKTIIDP